MKRKDKKSKKQAQEGEQSRESLQQKDSKIKLLLEVDELKYNALKCLMEGNVDDAIYNAEKIIRLAIIADMPSYIKEQEDFINSIACQPLLGKLDAETDFTKTSNPLFDVKNCKSPLEINRRI